MKKIGTAITDEEKRAEAFLRRAGNNVIDVNSCHYASVLLPVASPSYHGVESVCWHVALRGEEVTGFLRLGVAELSEFVNAEVAVRVARQIHTLGFAPKVLAADAGGRGILFERLDENWQVATVDRLMQPKIAEKLITMQKKIADSAALGRRWSVFDGIAVLYQKLLHLDAALPIDIDWMLEWMGAINAAITASGVDFKPAHGDPHSSNVMIGPDEALQLVDFDMAGDIDPYYSLGVLMNELYAFEEEMRPLLEIHEGNVRESVFCRCRAYALADDLYWALRALLMETLSRNRQVEFLKYACWRFLRCRMALGHPDFERTLRRIAK